MYETTEGVIGFMAMDEDLIDRLYVDPSNQGRVVGSILIKYAIEIYPGGLTLRTHERNNRARSFYENHGFKPVKFGVSPPPEFMPDVEYQWSAVA